MAEPARKTPTRDLRRPDREDPAPDDFGDPGISVLQRWVQGPEGRMELWETPLTPELFLDPQLEDKWMQGRPHGMAVLSLFEVLYRWCHRQQPDLLVLYDMKHLFGPGLPAPGPDISVTRGALNPAQGLTCFDLEEQGVPPCLIIEVVSPSDPEIRRTDEVDKVHLYERVGVEEYLLVHLPRRSTGSRHRVQGYRLDGSGRYRAIEPDARGRLLARSIGLSFGPSQDGQGIEVFDAATGEQVRASIQDSWKLEIAAQKAERAEKRAQAAEAEAASLRRELERLRQGGGS